MAASTTPLTFSPAALRRERQRAGMTQYGLVVAAGFGSNHVWRLEHGVVTPKGNTVARLAHALGCPIEALYERER
jgi:transcriptional regulator with XRE-family HTH domain